MPPYIDFEQEELAETSLKIGAIKLNISSPFEWASGYRMPIYNDNRMLLFDCESRDLVDTLLIDEVRRKYGNQDITIAGTSTAGIPWATSLANFRRGNLIYVRDKPKTHGLRNRIEGLDASRGLDGRRVVLIEDLISTGGSSVSAVQAIRDAGGKIDYCFSIFNYGFNMAKKMFRGEFPFDDKGSILLEPCNNVSIMDYKTLMAVAEKNGYIKKEELAELEDWRKDPLNWGEKRGFPRVEKA